MNSSGPGQFDAGVWNKPGGRCVSLASFMLASFLRWGRMAGCFCGPETAGSGSLFHLRL